MQKTPDDLRQFTYGVATGVLTVGQEYETPTDQKRNCRRFQSSTGGRKRIDHQGKAQGENTDTHNENEIWIQCTIKVVDVRSVIPDRC